MALWPMAGMLPWLTFELTVNSQPRIVQDLLIFGTQIGWALALSIGVATFALANSLSRKHGLPRSVLILIPLTTPVIAWCLSFCRVMIQHG